MRLIRSSIALILLFAACPGYGAQDSGFPSKPITVIVPNPPGASADTTMRLIAAKVSEQTGHAVQVDNRPGANGAVGAMAVAKAPPDGYLLYEAQVGTHSINPILYPNLPYEPVRDFKNVTVLWTFPGLLTVPASSPAHSVDDLVKLARSRPSGLTFASPGTGSGVQLTGEMFKMVTGANMVHVPYKGVAPAIVDIIAGRVDFIFVSYASIGGYMKQGRLRVLAVAAPNRLAALPDVPTMAEAGYPGVELQNWFGLSAPAGTPDAVVRKLNEMFVRAARDPAIVKEMKDQGVEIVANSPAEFAELIRTDAAQLGKVIKTAGVVAD